MSVYVSEYAVLLVTRTVVTITDDDGYQPFYHRVSSQWHRDEVMSLEAVFAFSEVHELQLIVPRQRVIVLRLTTPDRLPAACGD